MSDFGFRALNDSGVVTINADHITLAVIRRGTFAYYDPLSRQYPDNRHGVRVIVTYSAPIVSASPPVVAFSPRGAANGHWHAFGHRGGAGGWTGFEVSFAEFYPGQYVSYASTFQPPNSLQLWDYAAASVEGCPPSSERYGMRVFDTKGQIVFDSGNPTIKILGVVGAWSRIGNYPQWASYTAAWPYPVGRGYGFIASSLPMQSVGTSYDPYVSPRFGFSTARGGHIMCTVGGSDNVAETGIYNMIDSNVMPNDMLSNWLALNPIQLFAAKIG